MSPELLPEIINLAPQVAIVAMFLYFLIDMGKRQQAREKARDDSFIKAINAVTEAVTVKMGSVERKVNHVDKKVDKAIENMVDIKKVNHQIYDHMVKNVKKMEQHGIEPAV